LPNDDTNDERLLEALRTELGAGPEILLLEHPPAVYRPQSVIVSPGDPFLEPATHGLIAQYWDLVVVVSNTDRAVGVRQLRDISLRVRAAAVSVGAEWLATSGPRTVPSDDQRNLIVAINTIRFKTRP